MSLDRTAVIGTKCQRFHLCVQNKMTILSCPVGLLFDLTIKKCNYANLVICKEITTSTTTSVSTTTNGKIILKFVYDY
jgi:hypothetical protein